MKQRPQLLLEMVDMVKALFLEALGWRHVGERFDPPPDTNLLGPYSSLEDAFTDAMRSYRGEELLRAASKVRSDQNLMDLRAAQGERIDELTEQCRRLHGLLRLRDDETEQTAHAEAQRHGLTLALTREGPGWLCKILRADAVVAQVQSGDGRLDCLYEVNRWLADLVLPASVAPSTSPGCDSEDT